MQYLNVTAVDPPLAFTVPFNDAVVLPIVSAAEVVAVGAAMYVYPLVSRKYWVSGFVTRTPLAPAVPPGKTTVSWVALLKVTLTALVPPTLTFAPSTNPLPVIVTVRLPARGPAAGLTPVMVGPAM